MKRGEIYFARLDGVEGHEQGGERPVVILQNDVGNKFSPTTIVACLTTKTHKQKLPTQINIGIEGGLKRPSLVLCEQLRTIDKSRLLSCTGRLSKETMEKVSNCLRVSVGL